jgi:23S rRNA pseudouridine1911/1915/1917 synthase
MLERSMVYTTLATETLMTRPAPRLKVIYEDNHLLVVNKPAMLPTMGVESDRPSLLAVAKEYIGKKYNKPGKVYLGIVNRLDAPVTGVVLMARTSKAARRLSEAYRERQVEKIYWAVVDGFPDEPEGTLEHYLRKDERHRKVHVTHAGSEGAQLARLRYKMLTRGNDKSLLEIHLETGRKHQIRVQLSKIGIPILGDLKYGSKAEFPEGIALHAVSTSIKHPVRDETMTFKADLPASWRKQKSVAQLV